MATSDSGLFLLVADRLKSFGYNKIQYYPMHRIRHRPGREFLILRSFLAKNRNIFFKASLLQPIYEKVMRNAHPDLHDLYSLFLRCEELPVGIPLKYFNRREMDHLMSGDILSCVNDRCISNYRFIPVDEYLLISSPDRECDADDYVYMGEDAVIFLALLKKEIDKKVGDALEIGCGTGVLSFWLAKIADQVTSTDINERALEFTKVNAQINGIRNVVTIRSDVYSNVHGKFDLIIANPPNDFLPDQYTKRVFAYGGYLGTKITEKILLGLDDHLKDNGILFLTAVSYIGENGADPLYDALDRIFCGKAYSITLKQLYYNALKDHKEFYRQHGISFSVRYLIKVERSSNYEMHLLPIPGYKKLIETMKIKLLDRS